MKLLDDVNDMKTYFCFAERRSGYMDKVEDLNKLSPDIRNIVESEEVIRPKHLTFDLLKQLYLLAINTRQKNFKMDSFCEPVINAVCHWYRRDDDFIKLDSNYSLDKGIMLMGSVGCGKTLLMRSFIDLNKSFSLGAGRVGVRPFKQIESYHIAHEYTLKGSEIFDKGIKEDFQDIYGSDVRLNLLKTHLFIDDIGCEPKVSHYGNTVNIIGELILMRYDTPFRTAGTTNLDVKTLKELYGERVFSRMKEMFNFIHMEGNDRRK